MKEGRRKRTGKRIERDGTVKGAGYEIKARRGTRGEDERGSQIDLVVFAVATKNATQYRSDFGHTTHLELAP